MNPRPARIDPLDAWVLADCEAIERETAPAPEAAWESVDGFIDSAVAWLSRRDLSGEILGEIGRRLAVGRSDPVEDAASPPEAAAGAEGGSDPVP